MKRHLYTNGVPCFWKLAVYNDGSNPKFHAEYERAYKPIRAMGGRVLEGTTNGGVAVAKNALIDHLLADPAVTHLFICEDDILVTDPKAVTEYVRIAESSGWHHLSYAHHGPANVGVPLEDGDVSFFPHAVGAWSLYSRECLEKVGTFDTNFINAMEHVELSLRLAMAGYTTGAYQWADATHSAEWLTEIPGSIEHSSIRPRADWSANIRNSLTYWRDEKTESFAIMFGPGTPLDAWAKNIIG